MDLLIKDHHTTEQNLLSIWIESGLIIRWVLEENAVFRQYSHLVQVHRKQPRPVLMRDSDARRCHCSSRLRLPGKVRELPAELPRAKLGSCASLSPRLDQGAQGATEMTSSLAG